MKTTFKDLYLPVKNNLTGVIWGETHGEKDNLIKSVRAELYDANNIRGHCIILGLIYKGQIKSLRYGTTQKEIKQLSRDINDFNNDPHLFLNQ